MKSFDTHLKTKLENSEFKEAFEAEKELLDVAVKVAMLREAQGISQSELARQAHVTQQQVSKIEHGFNCNLITLLKVLKVLNLKLDITSPSTAVV
jgi:HTH-type transcriptional regulator / antitoxin HipB